MGLYRSVRAVANASGSGPIDWSAAAEAAKGAIDPGGLDLTTGERRAYATDVRDARDRVRSVATVEFDVPDAVEIQHRHHWIDANVTTFERVMRPIEQQATLMPGLARVANTGSMAVALSFLGKHVMGQYDPLLLADGDEHALYFVHPNIQHVARVLDVEEERFRRWIAFHEVAHAAEFGAAPWLSEHLETTLERVVEELTDGHLDRDGIGDLQTTMTAVEGYAELIMDRAFDDEYDDLREKLEAQRRGGGPVALFVRRLLGLGMKRRQYERGKAFFEAVADERGVAGASRVWEAPDYLPTEDEIEEPRQWLQRVPAE